MLFARIILLSAFISCVLTFNAQMVNIETKRIYDDSIGWSGNVQMNFSAIQNQDALFAVSLKPRTQFKTKKQNFFLLGDLTYSKGTQRLYANAGMLHFRYAYRIKQSTWKWEAYSQLQYNELLDQKYRVLAGGGIRDKFYDKNSWKFFVGTSAFFEQEKFLSADTLKNTVRWSNYLSWFVHPNANFTFAGSTYYQPNIEKFNDYFLSGNYIFSVKVTNRTDLRIEYTFFYDSQPRQNVRDLIYSLVAGVNYSFR